MDITAVGMAVGFLIEPLSANLPNNCDNKALAALAGIIGSILSWILNRVREVVG